MDPSQPPSYSFYLAIIVILLLLSMFFSASEIAFMSSSRLHIRYLREKKNRAASRVGRILSRKDVFLNAILIGNNIVNIASSALITAISVRIFGDSGIALATAAATVILLIFGEILPKSIALQRPESLALRFSLPLSLFIIAMSPVITVFTLITGALARAAGVKTPRHDSSVSEDDIRTLIETGEEEGLIEAEKRAMMHRILKYTDLTARDIMTPRTDIVAIGIDATRTEILELSRSSRFSRFPVCGENIDDIKGILYIKDFLFAPEEATPDEPFSVAKLLRPATFVFESRKISELQATLRSTNQNVAVIIDEYGGTTGLVTTEDFVEEIFGDLRDEYDRGENPDEIRREIDKAGTESWIVPGNERLDSLSERFNCRFESRFYDTAGGLVMELLGDIPQQGSAVTAQGFTFTVLSVEGNKTGDIRITRAESAK